MSSLNGSRTVEAERALLAHLAVELGASGELPAELESGSLEGIVAGLRPAGHALRLIELDEEALLHLEPPALTVLDGKLAVLRTIDRAHVSIELAHGVQQVLTARQLIADAGGRGIEIVRTLPARGSFVPGLGRLLSSRWRDLSALVLLALALAGLGLLVPLATQLTIDRALPERAPKLLSLLALGVLLVALQRAVFSWLQQRATHALSGRVGAAVATGLFDHLLRIPYPALVRVNVGAWLETLQSGQRVQVLLMQSVLLPLIESSMVVVYGIALAQQDALLALLLALSVLLPLALSLGFALRANRLERARIGASATQREALYEILSGVLTLRTAGARQHAILRWLERALEARSSTAAIDQLVALENFTVVTAYEAIRLFAFVWAGHACLQGNLSVGALLSVVMLADHFIGIVAGFGGVFGPISIARAHLEGVERLLALEDVTSGHVAAPVAHRSKRAVPRAGDGSSTPAVVLDDVWFRHGPDQPWVLQGYSLQVASLTQFALSGPSGSGKTTILRLIAGLYTPERGSVQVFGHPPQRVRREICYLPQDAHLFQGSIQQNLALLSDAASPSALSAAAERSGLAAFVATLPMGYETVLPPGATTLSGGQRQLIAWTAAMASGRSLLLVDEALSQVDRITRARLMAMIEDTERTTISVEHERA